MKKRRTVADLKLNKATRTTFTKHFEGKMTGREVQRKLALSSTRYYIICATILNEAIAKGQVKPEELFNN